MARDEHPGSSEKLNKAVHAQNFNVAGNFNLNQAVKEEYSIETLSFGIKSGVTDVTFRNKNAFSSLLHRLELLVHNVTPHPETMHFMRLEATYEYHLLLNLDDKIYRLELSQEIPAGGLDRFRIILGLARPNSSIIFPPFMPGKEGSTCVRDAEFTSTLIFYYDNEQMITMPHQFFSLYAFGFGHGAERMPEISYRRNLEMLKHKDLGLASSAVGVLARAADPVALPALRELASRVTEDENVGLREYVEKAIEHIERTSGEQGI
jgi:hypothetical protein